jgi:hypothetical protein
VRAQLVFRPPCSGDGSPFQWRLRLFRPGGLQSSTLRFSDTAPLSLACSLSSTVSQWRKLSRATSCPCCTTPPTHAGPLQWCEPVRGCAGCLPVHKVGAYLAEFNGATRLAGSEADPEASSCRGPTYVLGSRDTGIRAALPSPVSCSYVAPVRRVRRSKLMDWSALVSSLVDARL